MKLPNPLPNLSGRLIVLALAATITAFTQTGTAVPELAPFDAAVPALLQKYGIPGAAVSIAKDSRLVYSRGFGVADVETGEPVQPDSLFRVASVSKPLTAVGVLKLVEDRKLSLDTKVLPFIGREAAPDRRWYDITVRHLLQHSGGLDILFWGFDPSFPDRATLDALGADLPPGRSDILDFVLANLPLASDPGTRMAYSNVGYMLLTEVIEKASGLPYETYMREKIFAPLGITRMRIAGSLLTDRQPGEVRYLDGSMDVPIFPDLPAMVPSAYGTFNLRIFESGGGWLATTPDLVRFLTSFDGGHLNAILRPETVRLIAERPSYVPESATVWYGLGWSIRQSANGVEWGHNGAFQGTYAWIFRGVNGVSLALAANHLPEDNVLPEFLDEFEGLLNNSALAITKWPASDEFVTYFPGDAPRISEAGVVNGASWRPGPVAAGSMVLLFGVNLDQSTVRINGNKVDTLRDAPGRVYVQVPVSATGATTFEVERNGRTSNTQRVQVQSDAPAVFTSSGNGYGQAWAQNEDGSMNSLSQPAAPGSMITLFATGVTNPFLVVGDLDAEILAYGPARQMPPGVFKLVARLPKELPSGEQSVLVKSGDAKSQGGVTLAIQ